MYRDVCTRIIIVASFTVAKNWKIAQISISQGLLSILIKG